MISLFFLYSSWLWIVDNSIIVYNTGLWWSSLMMYQKVASCLHQSFLRARKQRGEDTTNFSQVFGGQEWTESALLFYEKFGDFCKKIKCRVPIFLMQWCGNLTYVFLSCYSSCSVDDILLLKDEKLFLIIVNSTFIWVDITWNCGIIIV